MSSSVVFQDFKSSIICCLNCSIWSSSAFSIEAFKASAAEVLAHLSTISSLKFLYDSLGVSDGFI
jgi:hypothetical protein